MSPVITKQTGKILSFTFAFVAGTCLLSTSPARAQGQNAAEPAMQTGPELLNTEQLAQQGKELIEKAKTGGGSAGITLSRYPGHYTMLTARSKSGGAEVHGKLADFLIVVDGQGTELTGGTVVDPKNQANGEIRGTRLDGATSHVLHKGDILHIPAGTPHQAIEAPGETITIYVIKVEAPAPGSAAQ